MVAGGCICGNVRYEAGGESEASVCGCLSGRSRLLTSAKILCHCKDCRKIGGSTYSTNGMYEADQFKVTKGTPKQYKKKGDSGNEMVSNFWYVLGTALGDPELTCCSGDCGSTMWRVGASFPGKTILKLGTLDDTSIVDNLNIDTELYADTRPKWVGAQEGADQKGTS